jgi:F-type H+-transporting ATPase subunit delta
VSAASAKDAKEYAAALFTAAPDPLKLRSELSGVATVASGSPRVKQVLLDASLESSAKQDAVIAKVFPKASRVTKRLLRLLVDDRNIELLPELARTYADLAAKRLKVVDLRIESAYPLAPADQTRIAKALPLAGRRPLITTSVNKDLIGGVRAELEGTTFDASLAGRLNELATTQN